MAVAALVTIAILSSDVADGPPASGSAWLSGTVDRRFELVAKHLRGFDVAMLETGHRYVELYWAGRDRNWRFAQYQIEKIRTAIDNGLERRPNRAASAGMLVGPLNQVEAAVKREDAAAFDRGFVLLTETCNACHRVERVPFVAVAPPTERLSPVRAAAASPPARAHDD